ncbi:MAG: RNA polymerase sigma factor [Thermoguttaceae bacterium]
MTKRFIPADEIARLVDTRFSPLVLFARTWGLDGAEDVVQNAFLKLVDHASKRGVPEYPVAWLYRTVRNEAVSQWRRKERRQRHETARSEQSATWWLPANDSTQDPQEMQLALEQLPKEQSEIVVLRIWGGLSFDEIAMLTETPKTTIFRRYTDALALLKRKLA